MCYLEKSTKFDEKTAITVAGSYILKLRREAECIKPFYVASKILLPPSLLFVSSYSQWHVSRHTETHLTHFPVFIIHSSFSPSSVQIQVFSWSVCIPTHKQPCAYFTEFPLVNKKEKKAKEKEKKTCSLRRKVYARHGNFYYNVKFRPMNNGWLWKFNHPLLIINITFILILFIHHIIFMFFQSLFNALSCLE